MNTIVLSSQFLFLVILFFINKLVYKDLGYQKYEFLNPINILLFLNFLSLIHIYFIFKDPQIVYTSITHSNIFYLIIKYLALQDISIIAFIYSGRSKLYLLFKNYFENKRLFDFKAKPKTFLFFFILLLVIVFRNLYKINIEYSILEIFFKKDELYKDIGIFYNFQQIIVYYLLFYLIKNQNHINYFFLKFICFLLFSLSITLMIGGRTNLLYVILFSLLSFLFHNKSNITIKSLLNIKFLFFASFLIAIFIYLPKLRNPNILDSDIESFLMYSEEVYSFESLFSDISGIDRHLFIIEWFDKYGYWWGRGYFDIIKILFASLGFSSDKPPGDDGLYINLMSIQKTYLIPPINRDSFFLTSYPPGNYALYMNFGPIGLILGYGLLGILVKYFFDGSKRGKFRYQLFYSFFVCGTIALSNLAILSITINIFCAIIIYFVHKFLIKIF